MTKLRQLWLLTALASVAALAGGYFLLVSPQKNEAAQLREDTETQLAANRQLQNDIDRLNAQKKDVPKQQAKLAQFAGLIPSNPALPALVRSLTDAADRANVELVSISPVLPTLMKAVNTETGAEIAGGLQGPDGTVLADIGVKMKVTGHYSNLAMFFDEIEELKRALLVSDFVVKPDTTATAGAPAGGTTTATAADKDMLSVEIGAHVLMTTKPKVAPAPTTTTSTDESK